MNTEPIVYVVDDDEQARTSVQLLARSLNLPSRAFASAEEFLSGFPTGETGCLVSDIRMPGLSGIELHEKIAEIAPDLPVILISAFARVSIAVQAMHRGAVTVLEKPYHDDELADAIRLALAQAAAKRQQVEGAAELRRRLDQLNDKERDVLQLLLEGKSNKAIARLLDVSIRTVESRRHDIFTKTGTKSVAELVRISLRLGELATA